MKANILKVSEIFRELVKSESLIFKTLQNLQYWQFSNQIKATFKIVCKYRALFDIWYNLAGAPEWNFSWQALQKNENSANEIRVYSTENHNDLENRGRKLRVEYRTSTRLNFKVGFSQNAQAQIN